jgi:hypothetical protein
LDNAGFAWQAKVCEVAPAGKVRALQLSNAQARRKEEK